MTDNTATNAEQQKPDPAEYNRLVAHAKVQTIRLINTRYDMKPAALSGTREDWDYSVSYRLLDSHCDNDAHTLTGTWEYTATCVQGKRKLLTVIAKYLVGYRLSDVCDPEAGLHFLERVGKFAAYPYFRSTFATLTQQSGIELHPLPIISEQPRWVTPPEPATKSVPEAPKKARRGSSAKGAKKGAPKAAPSQLAP
jgi:hypothetical protein